MLRACDNVYLTTTSSHRFRGIEDMVRQVGASKLVFGSDASYHELGFGLARCLCRVSPIKTSVRSSA